ncbi:MULTISPECIES: basic secretory family protein [Pedobacter]|uniref:basic secretory family protein n=1 Tax=Pedobacter TaxID=84567 RepID=UPI0010E2192E|nr:MULTISPECIES: basic secretory family protein [Pedobacter]RYF24031.1 MAG: secretory protein [Flavobacteriales bacterium]
MFKNLFAIFFFATITSSSIAQKKRDFTIAIVDPSNLLDAETKSHLTFAFNMQYPGFASADGYRTKRDVTLEVANNETETIKAKAGEIKVNSDWIQGKSLKKINNELKDALTKNWSFYSTEKHKGYKLTFISKDPNLDATVRQNLLDTYFEIYPTLVKTFNNKSTKDVLFVVDTAYKAVAEASGNRILFSAGYMKAHPTDIDVVTHETMHIVQGYGYSAGPVWLTEGIADYVRYKYGVDNVGSKWSLPAFNNKQSYTNSYRITARFFAWLEQNVKSGLIATLDQQLRAHQFTGESWANLTGKTIDQLWEDYSKNPNQVQLKYSDKKSK